jgi:hypothetical protein
VAAYVEYLVITGICLPAGLWLGIAANKALWKWEPEATPERTRPAIRATIIMAVVGWVVISAIFAVVRFG